MNVLALVPARGGSKGIPNKNLRNFAGEPLVNRAISVAHESGVNFVALSTDSSEIRAYALSVRPHYYIHRPADLAQDETPMLAVVQHAAKCLKFDVLVLLQPTQPLRKPEHIKAALKLLEETGADSVVSVVQIPAHYSPDYAVDIIDGRLFSERGRVDLGPARRQDARPAYSRDGTVYAIKRQTIEAGSLYGSHCVPLVIPSHESVNLDSEEDWIRAEAMVKR